MFSWMGIKGLILSICTLSFCSCCIASEKLEGTFELGDKLESNGNIANGKTRIYFKITGNSAKELYGMLDSNIEEDACTGYKYKSKANIVCYEVHPQTIFMCGFSINLNDGGVEVGQVGAC